MRDEIETTRAEKLLAWVLAGFLLVGGIWAYVHLDRTRDDYYRPAPVSAVDQAALRREEVAGRRVAEAQRAEAVAVQELELRREAYRTALDANRPAGRLESAYTRAERGLAVERSRLRAARAELAAARPAADAARERVQRAQAAAVAAAEAERKHDARVTFALRLGYVLATLGATFALLHGLRLRGSRYQVAGLAAVGFAAVQALVMAGDYITDYIDVQRLGPLVLSLAGIALTIAGLVALQRYVARRVPARRIRRGECPFCGFPAGRGRHCEGCGRTVVGACTHCNAPRRVGTPHCAACGG